MFSLDGRRLYSTGFDMSGRLWETFPWTEAEYPVSRIEPLRERMALYARTYWEERLRAKAFVPPEMPRPASTSINPYDWPKRDPATSPDLIHLTPYYTAGLNTLCFPLARGIGMTTTSPPRGRTAKPRSRWGGRQVRRARRRAPAG